MTQTILLLDDETDNIVLMEETLKRKLRGVSTVGFTSPLEALAWCAGHEPDLCLIDYKMPEMSGIEFLMRVRQNPAFHGIPMVMITGMSREDVQQVALVSGATEFLNKPIDPVDMVVRCQNLLASPNPVRTASASRKAGHRCIGGGAWHRSARAGGHYSPAGSLQRGAR